MLNKRTREREALIAQAAATIERALPDAFKGDAHAHLMTVYKDASLLVKNRLTAAIAAIGYEKPKLAAVDVNETIAVTRIELVAVPPASP